MTDNDCADVELPVLINPTAVLVTSTGGFTLEEGHPLRDAGCLFCHQPIGGEHAAVFGAAGILGDSCHNGCVGGNMFIAHSHCEPTEQDDMHTALHFGMACRQDHPWD